MAAKKKRWIKAATESSHGQFRRKAERAGESTRQFAKEKANAPGVLGKEARLAENLMAAGTRRKKLYSHPRSGAK